MILVGGRNYVSAFREFFSGVQFISLDEFYEGHYSSSKDDLIVFMASPTLSMRRYNIKEKNLDGLFPFDRQIYEKNLIFISSASVYGLSHKNNSFLENSNLNGDTDYAREKISLEESLSRLVSNTTIIRASGFYGSVAGHTPPSFINSLKQEIISLRAVEFDIEFFGKQIRDFTYIQDLIEIVYKLNTLRQAGFNKYNFKSTRPYVLDEIICHSRILNPKIKFNYLPGANVNIHSSLNVEAISQYVDFDFNRCIFEFLDS